MNEWMNEWMNTAHQVKQAQANVCVAGIPHKLVANKLWSGFQRKLNISTQPFYRKPKISIKLPLLIHTDFLLVAISPEILIYANFLIQILIPLTFWW